MRGKGRTLAGHRSKSFVNRPVGVCGRKAGSAAVSRQGDDRSRADVDANHFVNWGILVAAFGQLLIRLPLERWAAAGLAIGFGAVTAVLWEFAEYYTFIRNSPEVRTAYTDTLGDLALGLAGSVIAATFTVTVLWPKPRR